MTGNNDTSNHGGVVDTSILDTTLDEGELQSGIPTFLQRANEAGQHELVVEHVHTGDVVLEALGEDLPKVELSPLEQAQALGEDDEPELTGNLTHNPNSNQPASPEEMRKDFFKDVNKFGKASGEGASALGRLALRSLRAASDGVLSTAKPQGGGKDDATLVYEAYTSMDSKHAEHTPGGAKANASKLRQIIGMGCMTTIVDPVAVGDKVVRIREEMEGADLKPKALFAALVDVAREQQASDTELTDDAIRGALTKTKADKTLEKEWESINKRIEGLVTGEASHGLKDQSEAALKISQLVSEHIKNYKLEGTRLERIEDMMENGYTMAQATAIVDRKIDIAA
jgi:hypothetical protein